MGPRYGVGQKVIVRPVNEPAASRRASDIETYAGQTGEVADYNWISPGAGQVFYLYTVRVGADIRKDIVLHEDELESYLD